MAQIKFATTAEGVKFYPVTITDAVVHIKGNTQTKLSELLDNIDYTGKADKLDTEAFSTEKAYVIGDYVTYSNELYQFTKAHSAGAWIGDSGENADVKKVSGNFFAIDKDGNLKDSGKKATDFEAAGTVVTEIAKLDAEKSQTAGTDGLALSITEVDGKITAISGSIAANTYDAYGAAAEVLGDAEDTAADNTVYGAKAYADSLADNYEASGSIATEIAKLDASESQTAGADGLALSITEVGGKITAIRGSIAANTYDEYGAAAAVLGTAQDSSSDNTVYGAKKYADSLVAGGIIYKGTVNGTSGLPTTDYKKGDYYKVAADGTYAGHAAQTGDALIANKDYANGATAANDWDILQGSVAVTNSNASLVIGTATKIGEVEGVEIKVTQVEDMTKIEAVAVADTTDYADVTSLFTAPANNG